MTATAAKPSAQHELVITRVFDAPRKLVFEAWTDPRHIKNWFGPKDYPAVEMEINVRVGGKWRGRLKSIGSDPDLTLGGVYCEIVPFTKAEAARFSNSSTKMRSASLASLTSM